LVTDFDKQAEEKIISLIRASFPDHAILAEESGGEIGDGYTWLIDPLDGTSNFVMRNPLFSVAISVLYQREVVFASVLCPILGQLYRAEKGHGAILNSTPLHVSGTASLRDATFVFGKGRGRPAFEQLDEAFGKVAHEARTFRIFGSAAFDACQVAAGHTDGYLSVSPSSWDSLGPALIIEEAGGRVTNGQGERFALFDTELLATNGKIHAETMRALK
jgi:myo-inositol-1(or 4)-monophosphatase